MITRLIALASTVTVAWLLVDESSYHRLRNWIRSRFGGESRFGLERLRDEAAETADELRAVTLTAPDSPRGR